MSSHLRVLLLLALILPSLLCSNTPKIPPSATEQQNISPEEDAQIQRLSNFFIQLITQYDTSGNGLIKKQIYPFFLRDVFMKGSFGSLDNEYPYKDLLLEATKEFTSKKEDKSDSVSVQEFYDDIIAKFTLFVMGDERFKIILDTLFEDLKPGVRGDGEKEKEKPREQKKGNTGQEEPEQLEL